MIKRFADNSEHKQKNLGKENYPVGPHTLAALSRGQKAAHPPRPAREPPPWPMLAC